MKQLAESIETLKKELTVTTAPLPVAKPVVTSQQAVDRLKSRQQVSGVGVSFKCLTLYVLFKPSTHCRQTVIAIGDMMFVS